MPSSTEIPLIDVSGVLAGDAPSLQRAAAELRHAYEEVGFWFMTGHGLPQALIATGIRTNCEAHLDAGLRSLRWLVSQQTTITGLFRPIGSQSFSMQRTFPTDFDQQPLEATATVAACLAAWKATQNDLWLDELARATGWFTGSNDHQIALIDPGTGSCRDGLHPDRANENRGGESVVSYLMAFADHRLAIRIAGERSSAGQRQNLIDRFFPFHQPRHSCPNPHF